jgi:hypothetical protein
MFYYSTIKSKPGQIAHLIKNRFGSADNINQLSESYYLIYSSIQTKNSIMKRESLNSSTNNKQPNNHLSPDTKNDCNVWLEIRFWLGTGTTMWWG